MTQFRAIRPSPTTIFLAGYKNQLTLILTMMNYFLYYLLFFIIYAKTS